MCACVFVCLTLGGYYGGVADSLVVSQGRQEVLRYSVTWCSRYQCFNNEMLYRWYNCSSDEMCGVICCVLK